MAQVRAEEGLLRKLCVGSASEVREGRSGALSGAGPQRLRRAHTRCPRRQQTGAPGAGWGRPREPEGSQHCLRAGAAPEPPIPEQKSGTCSARRSRGALRSESMISPAGPRRIPPPLFCPEGLWVPELSTGREQKPCPWGGHTTPHSPGYLSSRHLLSLSRRPEVRGAGRPARPPRAGDGEEASVRSRPLPRLLGVCRHLWLPGLWKRHPDLCLCSVSTSPFA